MKSIKYLNVVLTVIAFCLVMITLSVTGMLSTATAAPAHNGTVQMPINPDGTVTVKFLPNAIMDVNVQKINGYYADYPVKVKIKE